MAIFMTILGKYSTHSHQWEGELCQGDKMQAIIYLGAQGWGCSRCAERAELVVPELHPSTTGLHILGEHRLCVRLSLIPVLHEELLHVQCPWHRGHQQQQWQGDRHQQNQRRHLGSRGRSQGVPHSAQGDTPPTPVILARGAASTENEEEEIKSSLPGKQTEKKMRWGDPALHCLPCSWHEHVPGQ